MKLKIQNIENLLEYFANKQFEIININLKYSDLPVDGIINYKGKKKKWWNCYFFNEEQYEKWKNLVINQIKKEGYNESYFDQIDMTIGLNVKKGS